MRVSMVGSVGLPANYGGFETLVENLVLKIDPSFEVTVYCSSRGRERIYRYGRAALRYIPLPANGLASIFYDFLSMLRAIGQSDVLLVLGVSGCAFLPLIRLLNPRVRIVTNVDGLEWRRSKWSGIARAFLKMSERMAVLFSHSVVADNQAIGEYLLDEYRVAADIVPYGGDGTSVGSSRRAESDPAPEPQSYAFTVCRIEPENNIAMILEAFERTNLPLVIVGNWGSSAFGNRLRLKYSGRKNYLLLDPIYDLERLNQLRRNCLVYVHGHSAGGTNPSLCEAMCLELPVFCFDVSFNRYTTENSAEYFSDALSLKTLVEKRSKTDLASLGRRMHEIGLRRYQWSIVVRQYEDIFLRQPGLA